MKNADEGSLVIGGQLRSARLGIALSVQEVAETLDIQPGLVTAWERGESQPPIDSLWALADLYERSVDYFLKPTPVPPQQMTFRLPRGQVMADLPIQVRKVIVEFEELCRAAAELEGLTGVRRQIAVDKGLVHDNPERLAARQRERLRLGDRPIPNLRNLLEAEGVQVFELAVPEHVFSGLSWWHDEYGPCILINAGDTFGRRAFTLAHEYAHLLAHSTPFVCSLDIEDRDDERFANRFAVSLLMPASDVVRTFNKKGLSRTELTDQQLGQLSSRYHVSLEAMGRRLEALGLVERGTTESLIAAWRAEGRSFYGRGKPKWKRRVGEAFSNSAFEAHERGDISIGKLAEYLALDLRQAVAVVEKERDTRGKS